MMTPIATRFVDWDIPELSTLQDSKLYQLRVQLNEGTPMSRQQKNWLTDSVNSNKTALRTFLCGRIDEIIEITD